MKYPVLPVRPVQRLSWEVFGGLNRNERIGEGELEDMENLSSDHYPVLAPRRPRAVAAEPASPQGLIAKDRLCYVDGADFVAGDTRVAMGLSVDPVDCPKRLVGMGAYVIILPDRKYINTADLEDFGGIEAVNTVPSAQFALCREDGGAYEQLTVSPEAPEEPANGGLWLDTASAPNALKQYSAAQGEWVGVSGASVKVSAPGIGVGLRAGDGVRLEGCERPELNGGCILSAAAEDFLVFPGLLAEAFAQNTPLTAARRMPELDLCMEAGNRLWGCRYGLDADGKPVNEICASALGDFRNWEKFAGLASDSYRCACGADGPFTGAVNHLGYPLFFRESCLHKVYGSDPSTYQVQTIPCRGVQPGCAGSLAVVGEALIYRSRMGYCGYDGAQPVPISRNLGSEACRQAVAGALGDKYYVSQQAPDGSWETLVFDSGRGLWHREDGSHFSAFAALGGELYAIDAQSRNILALLGSRGEALSFPWMARTGPLGLSAPDRRYISRLTAAVRMEAGTRLEILAEYDSDGVWESLAVLFAPQKRSFAIPLRPRRCSHLRLKLLGTGEARVYSLTAILEKGSDV